MPEALLHGLSIATATLVSEDLASISAGVLAADGHIGLGLAIAASTFGIFVGDVLLYATGRLLAAGWLSPRRKLPGLDDTAIAGASRWLQARGGRVILLSRFVPGSRLPTYVSAGVLGMPAARFIAFALLASLLWTPPLVILSSVLGAHAMNELLAEGTSGMMATLAGVLLLFVLFRLVRLLASARRRRLALGALLRKLHWEFWPSWASYPPVVLYMIFLGLKHRGFLTFTAVNPAIPAGGVVGESKSSILNGLSSRSPEFVAPFWLIRGTSRSVPEATNSSAPHAPGAMAHSPSESDASKRIEEALFIFQREGLSWPVVLKPDEGQRGDGVAIVRSEAELRQYLEAAKGDTILQRYVPGVEFGVFYYRFPDQDRGRILSITEKVMPTVTGDGQSTLEALILADRRAVCLAEKYLAPLGSRREEVPSAGQRVRLTELGTHSRGALFLNGEAFRTQALEDTIDRISRGYEGFFFGRYDIRVASGEAFQQAQSLQIVELNGVTSEATHIYDPNIGVLEAYRVLFHQWRLAYEIGAANLARGATPTPFRPLLRSIVRYLLP